MPRRRPPVRVLAECDQQDLATAFVNHCGISGTSGDYDIDSDLGPFSKGRAFSESTDFVREAHPVGRKGPSLQKGKVPAVAGGRRRYS